MAINPEKEEIFNLKAAYRHGIRRCASTLKRWIKIGKRSPVTGQLVKLEGFYESSVPCTSKEAYFRFLFILNGQEIPAHLRGLEAAPLKLLEVEFIPPVLRITSGETMQKKTDKDTDDKAKAFGGKPAPKGGAKTPPPPMKGGKKMGKKC